MTKVSDLSFSFLLGSRVCRSSRLLDREKASSASARKFYAHGNVAPVQMLTIGPVCRLEEVIVLHSLLSTSNGHGLPPWVLQGQIIQKNESYVHALPTPSRCAVGFSLLCCRLNNTPLVQATHAECTKVRQPERLIGFSSRWWRPDGA